MANIIQIAHEVDAEALKRVQDVLSHAQTHDKKWKNVVFVIERDEVTNILGPYDADAVRLLGQIQRAIDGIE